MHELQELDGELDVTDAAPASLHLAIGEPAAVHLAFGPGLHRPHRPHGIGIEHVGPDERLGGLEEARPEPVIAGNGPSLEERLEFPRLGPALVIRAVGVDGA